MEEVEMSEFMFLFRGGNYEGFSPEQLQQVVQDYIAWVKELRNKGSYKAGDELQKNGRIVKREAGNNTDGPFVESKEAVGGYFLIEAANYDEAVEIARSSPNLQHDGWVEVRQISDYQ
jgi:hypothetical protein